MILGSVNDTSLPILNVTEVSGCHGKMFTAADIQ